MTSRSLVFAALAWTALALTGCGGGAIGPDAVTFVGFAFRTAPGVETSVPPLEDLGTTPPEFGAPLDTVVVFRFDGPPEGPFDAVTLPVWALASDVPPGTGATPGSLVLAQGSYHPVGHTVEFRPQLPTGPVTGGAPDPAAWPGLLPGTVYRARVSDVSGAKLANLSGPGGEVLFETASDPAHWYPDPGGAAPLVVGTEPLSGAAGLWPSLFAEQHGEPGAAPPPGSVFGPGGPFEPVLTFDGALDPSADNLQGTDLDGDGLVDPNLFLSVANPRAWLGGTALADSHAGLATDAGALFSVALAEPAAGATPELVLQGAPGQEPYAAALLSAPASLAPGPDPSLLFAVLPVDDDPGDLLTVVDRSLGDPSAAVLPDATPVALPTGVGALRGLTALPDGRLVGIDGELGRIVELRPVVERHRPDGAPVLVDLEVGAGSDGLGFEGPPLGPGWEYLDLVSLPSGRLLVLARTAGGTSPSVLLRVHPIDPDLDGDFDGGDGELAGDLVAGFAASYVDVAVLDEERVWALDREQARLDRVHWPSGVVEASVALDGLGSLPDGTSPVRCLALPVLSLDVEVELLVNTNAEAEVRLTPNGVLPPGTGLGIMQRHALRSLAGDSAMTTQGAVPLGAVEVARLSTAAAPPGATVTDVFVEEFLDDAGASPAAEQVGQPADWGPTLALQGLGTDVLRASIGVAAGAELGDFRPLASPHFDPTVPDDPATLANETGWVTIFLDTDAQAFPEGTGSLPDLGAQVVVTGGVFRFEDVVIPEGVRVIGVGSRPLQIHATGRVELHGTIDVSGQDGLDDDSFDTGFLPVPGGLGGPGGGRGGDGQPTSLSPTGPQTLDQHATPPAGGRGTGPVVQSDGTVAMLPVGGHGGLSTLGYDPDNAGFPKVPPIPNTCAGTSGNEHHRPPGGGGGSFRVRGTRSHEGTGVYLVEPVNASQPFLKCPTDDKIVDALYGNEENATAGTTPAGPVQCVYMDGTPSAPHRFKPGALPGDAVFVDADPHNDFLGEGGEFTAFFGGQGGGGGGSRIDSMDHALWSLDRIGTPTIPPAPVHYPKLQTGSLSLSPAMFDAKGGGGGGGGGALLIRALGDVVIGRTGVIDASGGNGGGGETVGNSNWTGGGGGGSGGAIVIQSAGEIVLRGDADHVTPGMVDSSGATGALLDVSGGRGYDANTHPRYLCSQKAPTHDWTRSDGGDGGFGLIQLQEGGDDGVPTIEQGAFAGARITPVGKLGPWTDSEDQVLGAPSPIAKHPLDIGNWPTELWYVDMLHYRWWRYEPDGTKHRFWWLQGSDPPLVVPDGSVPAQGVQLDTPLIDYHGRRVVREPEPAKILASHLGVVDQLELLADPDGDGPLPEMPGVPHPPDAGIPLAMHLTEPAGLQPLVELDGVTQVDPEVLLDRLPVLHPALLPAPLSSQSRGTSAWLDFQGVSLRMRDEAGRPPPFFEAVHGTWNASAGPVPEGQDGRVVLGASVPGLPVHWVADTPSSPFDPGLFGGGSPPEPPYNDLVVNAPEHSMPNAVSDNAHVALLFQGAYGVRAGSSVPDPSTLTGWTGDLTSLSGFPLVRFSVVFDLGAAPDTYPFGPESDRPAVDRVRMRMRY